jgi:hypothetical protein
MHPEIERHCRRFWWSVSPYLAAPNATFWIGHFQLFKQSALFLARLKSRCHSRDHDCDVDLAKRSLLNLNCETLYQLHPTKEALLGEKCQAMILPVSLATGIAILQYHVSSSYHQPHQHNLTLNIPIFVRVSLLGARPCVLNLMSPINPTLEVH